MTNYVELHCHSCYSLLDGASTPEALLERAALQGMDALALTDHDAVYGAVRFAKAAREIGVRPIFGSEITLHNGQHLTLLVQNATGWANLCTLISLGRHNAPKGKAWLPQGMLEEHTEGLIALSGCRHGAIMQAIQRHDHDAALSTAQHYAEVFGRDRFYIELQHHLLPGDKQRLAKGVALAQNVGVGYVATNNVHYAERDGHRLQDILVCIREKTTLDEAEHLLRPNSEYFLKDADAMAQLFARYPDAIRTTQQIAEQCDFELQFGLQDLPAFPTPDGLTAYAYLERLCRERFGNDVPSNVAKQLDYELSVIERSGLSNYFLIVWDIVRYAKSEGIRCQGRGSAANSLVAYALDISPINPLEHNLVFERFLSDERQAVPDIDIDFDAARREEVIQYVYRTYGHERAAMACTFVTFRARSALRDVGRALGLPPELLDHASSAMNPFADVLTEERGYQEALNGRYTSEVWATLVSLCNAIDGFPRHLSIHNGGMVITGTPLATRLPTEPATMPNRSVVQWDKDSLEDAGICKIDILGLRMLSAVSDAVQILKQQGVLDDVSQLAFDDPAVYHMLSQADTVGVFQSESRAQAQVLPRIQPRTFNDLMVSISLIRPGPIQGNMVHPYLRRRLGEEEVRYPHALLQPALEETLGVVLFQEQVLKVARDLAGFTGGEGEQLRRALGSKSAINQMERIRDRFIEGTLMKDVERTVASMVFDTLKAFGGYSFPKSHAAAFAVIVYQSAWLKKYHPAAFYCGLLRNQPMGFWSEAVVVGDAKRHGIRVLPPHVNHSEARTTVQEGAIRLGLDYVHKIGEDVARRIVDARTEGAFKSLFDFCRRTQLHRRLVENMIMVGAFDGWGKSRRKLALELGLLDYREGTLPFDYEEVRDLPIPDLDTLEEQDIELMLLRGIALREHPMKRYRTALREKGILDSREVARCPALQQVKVAGMILVHQAPPTAKGVHFVTLGDEHELFINVVMRPHVWVRYEEVLKKSRFLLVEGKVERQGMVTNVVADKIHPLGRMV